MAAKTTPNKVPDAGGARVSSVVFFVYAEDVEGVGPGAGGAGDAA